MEGSKDTEGPHLTVPLLETPQVVNDEIEIDLVKYLKVKAITEDELPGEKTIGFWGSLALCSNNMTGPGMLALPKLYQQAGFVLPTVAIVLMLIISSFASTLLAEAMSLIPGNAAYTKRVEFTTAVEYYLGHRWHYLAQVLFVVCLQALNIASVVATAQIMDSLLMFISGHTYALGVPGAISTSDQTELDNQYVISVGMVAAFCLCMPFGYIPLSANIVVQFVACGMFIAILGEFFAQFFSNGIDMSRSPVIGDDLSTVLSVIIFSYAFVVTVPSWINEKEPQVNVNKCIWISTTWVSILYFLMGLFGAIAYSNIGDNFLNAITGDSSWTVSRLFGPLFCLGTVASSIPVRSIMVRYNLFVGGICSMPVASFWGVAFPWIIGILFYEQDWFLSVVNWTSLLFNGVVNYVMPFILYARAAFLFPNSVKAFEASPPWLGITGSAIAAILGVVITLLVTTTLVLDFTLAAEGEPVG